MLSRLAIAAALALIAAPAVAIDVRCENPRGPYLVRWSDGDKVGVVDPDSVSIQLPVIGAIDTTELRAVVFATDDPTVTEILHLEPEPKMEIFADGELVQVDACV